MTESQNQKFALIASYVLVATGLFLVLELGLLSAFLGGLLVYNIVTFGAKQLGQIGVIPATAKIVLLVLVSLIVIAIFTTAGISLASFINNGPESLVGLIKRLADSVLNARQSMPGWVQPYIPSTVDDWQNQARGWLLENAHYLSAFGRGTGMFLFHLVFGMIIGGLIAVHPAEKDDRHGPLARTLRERCVYLCIAFQRIVFSQIRISALNTFLTGLFLAVFMPMLGYELPLIKTMIVVTFIVGLMPILGNLVSNTVIVLISLGVSPLAAVSALIFLVVIHKLEYFVNARIIGTRIRAHSWEILLAFLAMDAAFGITGMIAAPIYYAYIKDELSARKLI